MSDLLNTPDGGLDEAVRVGKTYFRELRQERDALRDKLAAAKAKMQEGEDDCRFCRDLEGGSKYPCTCGWTYGALALAYGNAIQERDRLAADNARLREALDPIARAYRVSMEPFAPGIDEADGACHWMPHGWPSVADFKDANIALAATPAQSLAAHDAALLREVADGVDKIAVVPTIDIPQSMRDLIADAIRAKADRIEKGGREWMI